MVEDTSSDDLNESIPSLNDSTDEEELPNMNGTVPSSLGRFKPIFTEEMEKELADHCRDLDGRFYGIGTKNLRTIAYQFAELNGLGHCFNKEMAGFVKSSEEDPVLLILDNHVSHRSLEAVLYCREHHIILLSLPPHASHRLQPLDRSFFAPLKTAYSTEADKWIISNPGKVISLRHVSELFGAAYSRVATISIAANGFKSTGIFPFADDIFTDDDFRPSEVTDRVLITSQEERSSSSDDSDRPLQLVREKLSKNKNPDKQIKVPQTPNRDNKLNSWESCERHISESEKEPVASTSTCVNVSTTPTVRFFKDKPSLTSSSTIVSPSQIYPLPKAPPETQQRRKRSQKSELMTESPFKNELLSKDQSSKVTHSVKRRVIEDESTKNVKEKIINKKKKKNSNEIGVFNWSKKVQNIPVGSQK
ncbi:uncharacterized protein LOC115887620 [Sitophilus oryzae]|uniref:Uncharacterized protein LOC115887620 n=1 Tax=Sitophilus oryzae TaxID=7048 RepID=A0A6J2YI43_SITOR|nr:uncharacterized protein LOC115887620 [Sitophilus oryzae]